MQVERDTHYLTAIPFKRNSIHDCWQKQWSRTPHSHTFKIAEENETKCSILISQYAVQFWAIIFALNISNDRSFESKYWRLDIKKNNKLCITIFLQHMESVSLIFFSIHPIRSYFFCYYEWEFANICYNEIWHFSPKDCRRFRLCLKMNWNQNSMYFLPTHTRIQ